MLLTCPACEVQFSKVLRARLPAEGEGYITHVFAYACPHCRTAIGVESDIDSIVSNAVDKIVHAMRR